MHQTADDYYWIEALLIGDRKSIYNFVETYGNFMYHICFKVLLRSDEAEEACQDAVMKAIKSISQFDRKSSIKAWCYTIAFRTAIDYRRKLKPTVDIQSVQEAASVVSADHQIQADQTKLALTTLLSHLDDESRMVISLYYLEEKNIKEVMEITNLSESNIKIKLFRARKELAKYAPKYFNQY